MTTFLKSLCIFVFFRQMFAFHPCQQYSNKFIIEPADVTSYEGSRVNFTCSIRSNSAYIYQFFWHVDPENGDRNQLYHSNMSGVISTILTVQATGRTDYFITCNVKELIYDSERQNDRCFSTRRATLTIHFFPKRSEFQCSPNKSTDLRKGEIIDLRCSIPRSKPAVDLDWNLGGLNVTLPPVAKDIGRVRYLSYQLNVSQSMHLHTITCKVTSKLAFPGRTLNCSIGPFKVVQLPRVHVYPINAILNENEHVNILCKTDGYPSVFEFSWTCLPENLLNGCDTLDGYANVSLTRKTAGDSCEDHAYITVSCTAINMVGNASGSSNITIIYQPQVSPKEYAITTSTVMTVGQCGSEITLNITAHVHTRNVNVPTEITVLCLMSEAGGNSKVHWFYNRKYVNPTNKKLIVKKLWKSLYSLRILDPSQEDVGKEVACKVIVCNTTQTASLILSFDTDNSSGSVAPSSITTSSKSSLSRTPNSNKIATRLVNTITGAVVAFTIILTAVLVIVIFMSVYRRRLLVNDHGSNVTADRNLEVVDQFSLSSNANSLSDSTYEIPNVPTVPGNTTLHVSNGIEAISNYHVYTLEQTSASEDGRKSDLSSSSHSSWTSSSDTYSIEPGNETSSQMSPTDITSMVHTSTTYM